MMLDRQVQLSLTTTFAWFFWTFTVACLALAFVFDDWLLAAVGCASSGAAATLHIRSFFCDFSQRLMAAFELGRRVEREHQASLHSIS